jgi:hypothetical protein
MIKVTTIIAALSMALGTAPSVARAAAEPAAANFTAVSRFTEVGYFPLEATPFCGFGYHYACWYGAYGGRYCGCWAGGAHPACPYGYHFACRYGALGVACACY